jgi:hypothetical protein
MKYVYKLVNEDLTHLGGAMGTEYTRTRWARLFESVEGAKKAAEMHYATMESDAIKWQWAGSYWHSGDLRHTMYTITREKVES